MKALRISLNWSWIVPLLLLAAALSGSLLGSRGFDLDEAATLLRSGGHTPNPYNLAEIQEAILDKSPDQAMGWSLLVAAWGRVAGWSEVALRSLSWFAGLLALALTWRAGRDMLGADAGLVAAALLATSVLFVTYMAIARTYTLVVLFSVMALFGYWRAALREGQVGRAGPTLLLAGAAGLLYTHYFGALLLPSLGLFHLLMVRRNRRWLRTLAVFLLAGLAFLPQLDFLLAGIAYNRDALGSRQALAPHVALSRIVEVYSNGLFHLLPKVAGALFGLALLLLLIEALRRRRRQRPPDAAWLLVTVTLVLLALILAANEISGVLWPGRIRYTLGLWPLLALLTGMCLLRNASPRPPRTSLRFLLLALLLVTGLVGNVRSSLRIRYVNPYAAAPLHFAMRDLEPLWQDGDRLVIDQTGTTHQRQIWIYTYALADSRLILEPETEAPGNPACLAAILQDLQPHASVWLLFSNPQGDLQTRLQQALLASGMSLCRSIDYQQQQTLVLTHLARSEADCA
ncbi:MAG: glycosyltransferase family 39 protein [Anaerolineaceae bacterium]|nr:glycosyltransferase family 39 protein [Anaerolineaceae bacterium]